MDKRQELKNKLKEKITQKEKQRMGNKKNLKMEQVKSQNIYNNVKLLMEDIRFLKHKLGKKFVHAKAGQLLKEKYIWLFDNYFPIYRATVFEEVDLKTLELMLLEKNRVDTSQDNADKRVGQYLGDRYNVDMDKLKKDLEEKYGKQ